MKDYLNYTGKVCVVTGAASGMGKATAEILVDLGAEVHGLDHVVVDLPGMTTSLQVNLGNKDEIDTVMAQLPDTFDAFFGIAGVSGDRHDFNETMAVNFTANKYITEAYLTDRMREGGAIAFVTSMGGINWEKHRDEIAGLTRAKGWDATTAAVHALGLDEAPGQLAYPISKRATNLYVAQVAGEFAAKHVRVNAIMPASTSTGLTDDFARSVGGMDNLIGHAGFAGRLAESREMAEPLIFVNSPMASFISGVVLPIDYGGRTRELTGMNEDPLDVDLVPTTASAGD
ncbi:MULTISPECIES: SDR family oxidoreductase [Arsenicicoccus]|uniref:SDR family oxidoreductase n=1 Tax=Arsenicicoccus TaxID=267408 RepID=UPI00257ABCEC|nr:MULTISPECIES: SDR family oxidoreductase [Actinomycetes]